MARQALKLAKIKDVKKMTSSVFSMDGDFNCINCGSTRGQRGVTYWGPVNTQTLAPNGGSYSWTFTCTQPKNYQKKDNCNVSFNLFTGGNAADSDVGPVEVYLNGTDQSHRVWTDNYHSRIQGHDLSVAIDIGVSTLGLDSIYNDTGINTLTVVNNDSAVSVSIALLKIARVYQMCYLPCDSQPCTGGTVTCSGASPVCKCYTDTGSNGNMDYSRADHPCSTSAGGYSFTKFQDTSVPSIPAGSSHTFTWTNPQIPSGCTNNYVGPSRCLFNFNKMYLNTDAGGDDVKLDYRLNGSGTIGTFYISKTANGRSAFPFIDLCQHQMWYNDSPGATNTLTVINNGSVATVLTDPDYMDIYRIYRTSYP